MFLWHELQSPSCPICGLDNTNLLAILIHSLTYIRSVTKLLINYFTQEQNRQVNICPGYDEKTACHFYVPPFVLQLYLARRIFRSFG